MLTSDPVIATASSSIATGAAAIILIAPHSVNLRILHLNWVFPLAIVVVVLSHPKQPFARFVRSISPAPPLGYKLAEVEANIAVVVRAASSSAFWCSSSSFCYWMTCTGCPVCSASTPSFTFAAFGMAAACSWVWSTSSSTISAFCQLAVSIALARTALAGIAQSASAEAGSDPRSLYRSAAPAEAGLATAVALALFAATAIHTNPFIVLASIIELSSFCQHS